MNTSGNQDARIAPNLARSVTAVLGLMCAMMFSRAWAIEDTDTPGDRRWEINLGASAARTIGGWSIAAPDADVNYGWGEHVQLIAAVSRITLVRDGVPNKSDIGPGLVGVKWRFIDQEVTGIAMSTFPQYSWNLSSSADQSGTAETGRRLALPLGLGIRHGNLGMYGEVTRTLLETGPNEWRYGVKFLHQCAAGVECRLELERAELPKDARQTMASVGFKWNLTESFLLKAAIGREFCRRSDAQENRVVQLGVQILR